MIEDLILPAALRAQIDDAAREACPRECCGLIEGLREGTCATAIALHPVRNMASDPDSFEIAPADHFRILRAARAHGRTVIGCYHSHPGGRPAPSPRDGDNPGADDFVWLIAALPTRANALGRVEFGGFAAARGAFRRLRLVEPALA